MGVYEELQARGLIAQVTNEEEIRKMVNEGKAVFYIGFDPTADSLHVGHFMALCLMKRLQMAGNKPIALIGGGTGMVGDPSGRSDMRQMMTVETIQHNCDCFKKQMSRFIDFSDGKAMMVNNAEWLLDLNLSLIHIWTGGKSSEGGGVKGRSPPGLCDRGGRQPPGDPYGAVSQGEVRRFRYSGTHRGIQERPAVRPGRKAHDVLPG